MNTIVLRNVVIIGGSWTGGMLVGMGLSLSPLITFGVTIWIATAVYGFLTRTRRLR